MNKVTYEARKGIYKNALAKWGAENQMIVAMEEMSELTKELCKIIRGKKDLEALAEEIADVTVMMEQLRIIFDCNDLVCAYMDGKIQRLQSRIKKEG